MKNWGLNGPFFYTYLQKNRDRESVRSTAFTIAPAGAPEPDPGLAYSIPRARKICKIQASLQGNADIMIYFSFQGEGTRSDMVIYTIIMVDRARVGRGAPTDPRYTLYI